MIPEEIALTFVDVSFSWRRRQSSKPKMDSSRLSWFCVRRRTTSEYVLAQHNFVVNRKDNYVVDGRDSDHE